MISTLSVGRVLTLRVRHAELLQALAASALVFGCATPAWQSVPPGASEAELQAALGTPSEVYRLPDGSRRWLYPRRARPNGQSRSARTAASSVSGRC
jgi:hypothetical protein